MGKILIVDDDQSTRHLLKSLLSPSYEVREAADGQSALEIVASWSPDLVLLDLVMPGLDGFEICVRLKALQATSPPHVVIVSAEASPDEQTHAFDCGADDYLVKPIDPVELRPRVALHFRLRESRAETAALQAKVDAHRTPMKDGGRERINRVVAVQNVAVMALAKVAESRDNETGEHIIRMRDYSCCLARDLQRHGPYRSQIDSSFLEDLYRSAPLHDIGKVGIPDSILLKPARLTPEEFDVMKRHTVIGARILSQVVAESPDACFLSMATTITQFHHERWDGRGYPAGLVGRQIPLPARIVAVADVYDALTSARPYKQAWTPARARETILEGAGKQFDPAVVEAFTRCEEEFRQIRQRHQAGRPTFVGAMALQQNRGLAEICPAAWT